MARAARCAKAVCVARFALMPRHVVERRRHRGDNALTLSKRASYSFFEHEPPALLSEPWWFGLLWAVIQPACHGTLASGAFASLKSRSGSCGAAWRFESELRCCGRGFGSATR